METKNFEKVTGVVEKISKKQTATGIDLFYYVVDKVIYSGFNDLGFEVGDMVELQYVVNGKFNNIGFGKILQQANPKIVTETVKDFKTVTDFEDLRKKQIALGQAHNLALQHIHWMNQGFDDEMFKVTTKRFYNLLLEVQKEVLYGNSKTN